MSERQRDGEWSHILTALDLGLGYIAVGSTLEQRASGITGYSRGHVPGLLMTEAYMRARYMLHGFTLDKPQTTQLIALRKARQEHVIGSHRQLDFFIGSSALSTTQGAPFTERIIREQAEHLTELTRAGWAGIRLVKPESPSPISRELSRDSNASLTVYYEDRGDQRQPFAAGVEIGLSPTSCHFTKDYYQGRAVGIAASGMNALEQSPGVLSSEASLHFIETVALGRAA